MANNSQEILKKAGIKPKLKLFIKDERGIPQPTGQKKLVFVEDKVIKKTDEEGKELYFVKFYFKDEEGHEFEYKCDMYGKDGDPHYLIQRMAEIKEGEEITIEGKKGQGGSFISVMKEGEAEVVEDPNDY